MCLKTLSPWSKRRRIEFELNNLAALSGYQQPLKTLKWTEVIKAHRRTILEPEKGRTSTHILILNQVEDLWIKTRNWRKFCRWVWIKLMDSWIDRFLTSLAMYVPLAPTCFTLYGCIPPWDERAGQSSRCRHFLHLQYLGHMVQIDEFNAFLHGETRKPGSSGRHNYHFFSKLVAGVRLANEEEASIEANI